MIEMRRYFEMGSLPIFFLVKLTSGLIILKVSSVYLPVDDFSVFAQFLLLGAMLNMVSVGGVQNGLVRQIAASSASEDQSLSIWAGFLIWASAFVVLALPILAFRNSVSTLLIGNVSGGLAVGSITLAVFVAGPAQIFCAQLAGRRSPSVSFLAQGIALLSAMSGCVVLLYFGHPTAAACAFYWGAVISVPISWVFVRKDLARPNFPLSLIVTQAIRLMRYSITFVALVGITSITLFGLRYAYQDAFGLENLSFWLVAQRVSDTSTQFLGLYMTQYFMPHLASSKATTGDHAIIVRGWLTASAAMACLLACFAMAPELAVSVFLSDRYIPAAGLIMLYMAGDTLRATVSLAMHAAFARNRLLVYVGIEAFAMAIFSAITLVLVAHENTAAPFIAYIIAFGAVALLLIIYYTWREMREPRH